MMRLDGRRRSLEGNTLDHIGVERPLGQVPGIGKPCSFSFENLDEEVPYYLSLLLRIGHTLQSIEELIGRIHVDEIQPHVVAEDPSNALCLSLAKETVIHKDAVQLRSDRLVEEGRN